MAGPDDVVDLVVALVQHAGRVQPPHDVPAAVHAWQPDVTADGEGDRAARPLDLVGQLDAGRGRADDQHPAVVELAGIAVLRAVIDLTGAGPRPRRQGRRARL